MGLLDSVKGFVKGNKDKVHDGIDKAAELVDDKTKGKYSDKVDTVQGKAKEAVEKLADDQEKPGGSSTAP